MIRRKHAIIRTNLYNQLDIARWDTVNRVFAQMDKDLFWSSWDMIVTPVNRVTSQLDVRDCVIDIMELL